MPRLPRVYFAQFHLSETWILENLVYVELIKYKEFDCSLQVNRKSLRMLSDSSVSIMTLK